MFNKRKKKGFTLVELLAVIVVLAVVILIAVTAVIPRINSAKKKALFDEALVYLKAAKEAYTFDSELLNASSCTNITDLNGKYINKSNEEYKGAIKTEYNNGVMSQTINLTDGRYFISGSDNITVDDILESAPDDFLFSCGDYNPLLASNTNVNALGYKLLMNEGGSSLSENLNIINNKTFDVNFNNVETDASNSGLYVAEDDDGASFYYRGVVNNNWVEFAGFYWRVVRINGDGSLRMIYSGLKNSTHTGSDASIISSGNVTNIHFSDSTVYKTRIPDISNLSNSEIEVSYTNGGFQHSDIGYMYNPEKVIMRYQDYEIDSNHTLSNFNSHVNINNNKNDYYFFKNFDPNINCNAGSRTEDTGTCTLVCRKLGDDCVASNWNTLATTEGNYSTTAPGVVTSSSPAQYVYTGQYKYTCWEQGTPVTKVNSDGTTSVYISCPVVSEIVGTLQNTPTKAKVRLIGLFSPSEYTAHNGVKDSNIKSEIDTWYEHNILNKKDSTNVNYLEDYLADEIFCNDRDAYVTTYPFQSNGSPYLYTSYARYSRRTPSFKCTKLSRDGFTINETGTSRVASRHVGNLLLKYPIGLITSDEVIYAGSRGGVENKLYYLYSGKAYYTMTPAYYSGDYNAVGILSVHNTGRIFINIDGLSVGFDVRPVINLKASVLYDSGSGTEADPYKVKLPTT